MTHTHYTEEFFDRLKIFFDIHIKPVKTFTTGGYWCKHAFSNWYQQVYGGNGYIDNTTFCMKAFELGHIGKPSKELNLDGEHNYTFKFKCTY